jgi:hypothetical protein
MPSLPLLGSSDPDSVGPADAPCTIELAAHAEHVAADLHARFGDMVELRVGLMAYPEPERFPPQSFADPAGRPGLAAHGLTVALAGPQPPRIESGRSEQVELLVTNHSAVACHLQTNGVLQTYVVDSSGTVVGCFSGMQHMPLVVFTVEPDDSVAVPALLGTASLAPELGYAVPAGRWGFVARVELGGYLGSTSRKEVELWSEPLPLDVVEQPTS